MIEKETIETVNRRAVLMDSQGRNVRNLRRDIRVGAVAGFMLGACLAIIAYALALTWGTP